eukprot:CAMPEP_0197855710 /NCGR_PEP_ID=MMETSP1438-20131217/27111_1 /TAXON_ID=1461541 /ORGANISM="Pterosperma sp., Strain CCMP1384" /LENGTH=246 /DNA_ID=CAMNT_0043470911 /DNA_START=41 /DNA_END=784 /DNA_ORIENTATION=-
MSTPQTRKLSSYGRHSIVTTASASTEVALASTYTVTLERPLGMVLAEEPPPSQNVFVEEIAAGGNAAKDGNIKVGDVIVSVGDVDCQDIGFDSVMGALTADPDSPTLQISFGRYTKAEASTANEEATSVTPQGVEPEAVEVEVEGKDGTATLTIQPDMILRAELLEAGQTIYDGWGTMMNCNGGGQCGLCMVEVLEGEAQLSGKTSAEERKLKKRPDTWRLACQTVVDGMDPDRSKLRLKTMPQKK